MDAIPVFISNREYFFPPGLRACKGQQAAIFWGLKEAEGTAQAGIITLEPKDGGSGQKKTVGIKGGWSWEGGGGEYTAYGETVGSGGVYKTQGEKGFVSLDDLQI